MQHIRHGALNLKIRSGRCESIPGRRTVFRAPTRSLDPRVITSLQVGDWLGMLTTLVYAASARKQLLYLSLLPCVPWRHRSDRRNSTGSRPVRPGRSPVLWNGSSSAGRPCRAITTGPPEGASFARAVLRLGPCDGEASGHEGDGATSRRVRFDRWLLFRSSCREHRITRPHVRDGLQRRRAPAQRVAFTGRSSSSSQRARVGRQLECDAATAFRCPRDARTRG